MLSQIISATLAGFLVGAVYADPTAYSSAAASSTPNAMLPLRQDSSFSYEILRDLGLARYSGADVGEVLQAAGNINAGDMEGFSGTFASLAHRVYSQAQAINSSAFPVSARDFYFRAATYFRSADFYLHGNASDPRIMAYFASQTAAFDTAISQLDIPGQRINLSTADGAFTIPGIYHQAAVAGEQTGNYMAFDEAMEAYLFSSGLTDTRRSGASCRALPTG